MFRFRCEIRINLLEEGGAVALYVFTLAGNPGKEAGTRSVGIHRNNWSHVVNLFMHA